MKQFLPSLIRRIHIGGNHIWQWLVYNQFISFYSSRLVPVRIIAVLLIFFISIQAQAQDVLVGLTSDYGLQGGGTAFSIKTDGKG
ncbi:MAG: hypothetical protein M3Q05_14575, partial [Bacteroidota bacterium]|nr:hypothetical protein [Bacteroidota bacterium]